MITPQPSGAPDSSGPWSGARAGSGATRSHQARFLHEQTTSLEGERIARLRDIHGMVVEHDDPDAFLRACVETRMKIVISGGPPRAKPSWPIVCFGWWTPNTIWR